MCAALSAATDKDIKQTPEEATDNWIEILAQRQHVTYSIARWHIRKLFRQYGGSNSVMNECLDRDLVIDLSDRKSRGRNERRLDATAHLPHDSD